MLTARLLALSAALAASSSLAAPTVAVSPFKGKTGPQVRAELKERLCAVASCVEAKKKGGKQAEPDFTVNGSVGGDKKKPKLQLEVVPAGKKKPSWKKSYALSRDGRSLLAPDEANLALAGALGLAATPALEPAPTMRQPAAAADAAPGQAPRRERVFAPLDLGGGETAAPAPKPEAAAEPPPARPFAPAPRAQPTSSPAPEALETAPFAAPAPHPGGVHAPLVSVQAGLDVMARTLNYSGLKMANLRGYRASPILLPGIRAQLRPFSGAQGWLARLRLEGDFATSVGLRSSIPSRTATYPSSVLRAGGGLRVDAWELPSLGLGLEAFAGYRLQSFNVGKASDGSELDGLVHPAYSAVRLGVGGTLQLGRVTAFAELAAMPVVGSGELQKSYFPSASGLGLEGQLGADVALNGWLGVRLTGLATHYGMAFKTADTDPYIATGSSDLYVGANAALRISL